MEIWDSGSLESECDACLRWGGLYRKWEESASPALTGASHSTWAVGPLQGAPLGRPFSLSSQSIRRRDQDKCPPQPDV